MRLWVLFFMLLATPTWAATYYVGPTGSDATLCATATNTNTPRATPVGGAACLTAPGDILHIKAGTYTGLNARLYETVITVPNGSSNAIRTIIEGEGAEGCAMTATCLTILRPTGNGNNLETPSFITLRKLELDQTNVGANDACLRFGGTGASVTIEDVLLHHCQGDGLLGTVHNLIVRRVHVHHVALNGANSSPAHGFYLQGDDNVIEYSSFHDIGTQGINTNSLGGQCYSSTAANGQAEHDRADRCIVRYSQFYLARGGGLTFDGQDVQAYGNIIRNNNATGLAVGYASSLGGPTGSRFFNNTIYSNLGDGIQCGVFSIIQSSCNMSNNLIVGNVGPAINLGVGNPSWFAGPWTNSGTPASNKTTGTITDCTISTSDLHLKAGANVCVDTGITPSIAMTDFDGVPRPLGSAFDIGAYEFGTVADTTAPAPPSGVTVT